MDDDVQSVKLGDRASKRGCVGRRLVVLAVVGAVTGFVYFQFHPRDRVAVEIKNIPADTRFLCVVAETDDGMLAMNWSPAKIMPFEMKPGGCTMSYVMGQPAISNRHVMWRFGSRYAVVTRQAEKAWQVHWFQAESVPLQGRGLLLGEGGVSFDILRAKTEQLPAEVVRELGFGSQCGGDER